MLIDSKIIADVDEPSPPTFTRTQTSDGVKESLTTTGEKGLEDAIEEPLHDVSPETDAEQGVMAKKAKKKGKPPQTRIELVHCDIIKDDFWNARPGILGE
jgi:tRNA(His) guanylyltransferase